MTQSPFDLHAPSGSSDLDTTRPSTPAFDGPPAQRTSSPSPPLRVDAPAHLIIQRGPDAGTAIALTTGSTAIGRHRECDIVLEDSTVSRRHACLHRHGDRYVVTDSGSLNGTYLNRYPVDRAELTDGDELWIGKVRFIFQLAR